MKGILFTACLTILALVVLTASFMFYQQGIEEQGTTARFALFDRIADEFSAAENGFREILEACEVNISVNGNTVTISEPLPNPNSDDFSVNIESWKTFVEDNSDFSTTVDLSGLGDELPIYFNGIRYYHPSFGGNIIRITNASEVTAYSVSLQVNTDGNIDVTEDTEPGSNSFELSITTNTDSYYNSWSLDFSRGSDLDIIIENGDTYEISVTVGSVSDYGWLNIDNTGSVDMDITTAVTLSTKPAVMLSEQSINITESQYNISRVSSVKIM